MPKRTISIPLSLGLAQRVDPKVAPLGVLAVASNLRVRKDGRLVSRNGYALVSNTTRNGSLVAYDLTSYRQRLVVLGNDASDGYPTDLFEFTNTPTSQPWRATDDTSNQRVALNPLTNWREVCGIPQPDSGVAVFDCASGGGYVATCYRPTGSTTAFWQIVRESDDQVIAAAPFAGTSLYTNVKVAYASGSFWFLGPLADNSAVLSRFTPGTDTSIQAATTVEAASANPVTAFEIRNITNPSTGVIITCVAKAAATTTVIKRWTTSSTQDGATNSVALASVWVDIEADFADNTVNLAAVTGTTTATLRTFNFANALTVGPTATTAGRRIQIARLPQPTPDQIAVAVNSEVGTVVVQYLLQSTHAAGFASMTVFEAQMSTRLIDASSTKQQSAVIFGGWVEPRLAVGGAAFNTDSFPTNALFWVSTNMSHMATRDLSESSRFLPANRMGLSFDTSNNRAAWCSTFSFELDGIAHPTITCFDFKSTKRRQSAEYGGMLYLAGGAPSVYDGHLNTEIGFNEIPGIQSITPSTGAGALSLNAQYQYVLGWEFIMPDGTVAQGPISVPFQGNTSGTQNTNTIVATTPHTIRLLLGGAAFGSDVTAVLYRTEWNGTSAGGIFRRCQSFSIPNTIASWGQTIQIVDLMSDTTLASQAPVYTQADRGPIAAPRAHNSPEAFSYVSASSARILTGAMARSYEFQESNESFLGEPINFTRFPNFFGKASSQINGVVSLDGIRLICSRERIYAVIGVGPDDTGAGALPSPVEVPAPAGLLDWKSLLVAPDGVYAQLASTQLYRISRDGSTPEWVGVDVQDELAGYPVITGACRVRQDDVICFACENLASSDARIIVRSLRTGLWTEDLPPLQASQGIEAMCEFGDSCAYVSGGRVYILSTTGSYADSTSTVITTQVKTNPLYPFELGGYGSMDSVLLTGEFRSAGTLALRVSYDDGISFQTYDSFTLTGLSVGQTVQRRWALQQADITSVVFEWTFTPSAPGEGFIADMATLLVDPQPGQLKELDPSEMA